MSNKNKAWFKPVRNSYLPNSGFGWLTYIPFTFYLLLSAYIPYHYCSSAWLGIFITIQNWFVATYLMTVLAKAKS